MASSDIPTLEELEARLRKLQDRPYIPSKEPTNEVDKLMQQMESEIRLEKKSKELSNSKDRELSDRLKKLKEDIVPKPANLSFDKTKSIIANNVRSQAKMASRIARQTRNEENKKSLINSAIKLNEVSKIIGDISPKLEKQGSKVFDIIANSLIKIYDGIKKITSPAINTLKKRGNVAINLIKSLSKKFSDKQVTKSTDRTEKQQKIQKNRQKFKEAHVIGNLRPSNTPNVKGSIKRRNVGR